MDTLELLRWAEAKLSSFKIESPRRTAEILLGKLIACDKIGLYLDKNTVKKSIELKFRSMVSRRIKGVPVQYITGSERFMDSKFLVSKDVLIPRPETEELVERLVELYDREYGNTNPHLLDIGTGPGIIAISLTKLRKFSKIYASDISKKALKIALKNARLNRIFGIDFLYSDIYKRLGHLKGKLDIIVSNPPYISRRDYLKLPKELKSEPKVALYGGINGLKYYRRIISSASEYIKRSGGYLALEIGYDQAMPITAMLKEINSDYTVYKDLSGHDRIIIARINK